MQITFLGTGSAFTTKNYQTNFIIKHNGKKLLVDAGGDLRWSLKENGLGYKDIDSLYVTHAHTDHIGGIEFLAFCRYFDPVQENGEVKKIKLYGASELILELWDNSLRGGLKSIQGKKTTLMDFFDVVMVPKNENFYWEGIRFDIVQSVHVMDGYSIVPSYGIIFKAPNTNTKIFYTGDTQFNPNQIFDFYKYSDIIIQDCETTPFRTGVHANYDDLKTLSKETKAKMYLVHYNDNILDLKDSAFPKKENSFQISDEWKKKINNDGFIKFIEKCEIIEI